MTLCVIPFMNLTSNSRGDIKMCCNATSSTPCEFPKKEDGTRFNLAEDNIAEVWNTKEFRTIRKDMLEGKRNPTCERCYQEEDAGIESHRIKFNKRFEKSDITFEEKLDFNPLFIDFRLSTLCNLKCRMCTPFYSSQWVDEWNEVSKLVDDPVHRQLKPEEMLQLKKSTWSDKDKVYENLDLLSETITEINLQGGEPTLIKQNIDLLEMVINKGRAKDVVLKYISNITNISERQYELWKEFKHLIYHCSIDAHGPLVRYIRHPADWDTIEENFIRLHKLENAEVFIDCTITAYSILRLPKMIEWAKNYPNATLFLNVLDWPNFINIRMLPPELKQQAEEQLQPYMYHDRVPGIIKYMYSKDWYPRLFGQFTRYTNYLDNSRNEKLIDYLPEFKEYGFD